VRVFWQRGIRCRCTHHAAALTTELPTGAQQRACVSCFTLFVSVQHDLTWWSLYMRCT
jgi:hypothetical protein